MKYIYKGQTKCEKKMVVIWSKENNIVYQFNGKWKKRIIIVEC